MVQNLAQSKQGGKDTFTPCRAKGTAKQFFEVSLLSFSLLPLPPFLFLFPPLCILLPVCLSRSLADIKRMVRAPDCKSPSLSRDRRPPI